MRRSSLDSLRSTLLAACGLSLAACKSVPAELPTAGQSAGDETPTAKPEPKPDPKPKPEPPPIETACADPSPVLIANVDSGYVRCADGALNRASARACANPINAAACQGTERHRDCQTHADCTDKPHGFCKSDAGQIGTYCGCIYPCIDDSECSPDQACLCPDVPGIVEMDAARCAPAECITDADCGSGECGASYYFNGCGHELALQCRGEGDSCRSDVECEHGSCASLPDRGPEGRPLAQGRHFECAQMSCMIGRPLSVAGDARVAGVEARAWRSREAGLERLAPAPDRAAHWLAIAQLEHASVASFARFADELLRFGAPPQLLRDAFAAARDEVGHAEQTFALASAYAGAALGPGPLALDGVEPSASFEDFVTRLIHEACVGETVGVAEALALLDGELDPSLRPVLEQIATDERRHAALAWRTLRWAAPRVEPAVLDRAFDAAIAAVGRVSDEPADPAHGRLGREARQRVRLAAIAEVVEPCRRALRASSPRV